MCAATEEMFTRSAARFSEAALTRSGPKARTMRSGPARFVSIMRCHSLARPSVIGFGSMTPAAFTTRSTRPMARYVLGLGEPPSHSLTAVREWEVDNGGSVPDACLDHQRQDAFPEHRQLGVRVDEAHDHAAHAGLVELLQPLDDLLGRADERVATPARDEPLGHLAGVVERLARPRQRDLDDVARRAHVALVDHLLEGGLGL